MKVADFSFHLPEELIARYPMPERTNSRLLSLEANSGELSHLNFTDIIDLVNPNDLIVFNDTRVIPARLFGSKETGGKIEVLVERVLDEKSFLAHVRSSKSPKPGCKLLLENDVKAEMVQRQGPLFEIKVDSEETVLQILERIGHMPYHHILIDLTKMPIKSVTKRFIIKTLAQSLHQRLVYILIKLS